jgi:hypothetical protein
MPVSKLLAMSKKRQGFIPRATAFPRHSKGLALNT